MSRHLDESLDVVHNSAKNCAAEIFLAKRATEVLMKHYPPPGHLWAVSVDSDNGIMVVKNMALAGNYGFVLHLNKITLSDLREVRDAGGEILERYRMARSGGSWDAILEIPRDFKGIPIGDKSWA